MNKQEQQKTSSAFLKTDSGKTKPNTIEVPAITLPKGGGAIKGIDEKFAVSAVNGTSSFSIPLPFTKARALTPELSLVYNSGAGNGSFGLGWNLQLPSIKRKTDKQLPQYLDGIDSDTFVLSEAEDLVPEFKKQPDGRFLLDDNGDYTINEQDSPDTQYAIRYYRPRIEGLFARIERWTEKTSGTIKWRVISKENRTTLFGWTPQATIADPQQPGKIFEWLPEFVFDDKGNCVHYRYKKDDLTGFAYNQLHNRNRVKAGALIYTNTYPDKLLYGNRTPYRQFGNAFPPEEDYLFQTVFDYGTTDWTIESPETIHPWDFRPDAFSDYKAGFEIRTTRLCKRVLLFHVFEELALQPDRSDRKTLVRSVNIDYDTNTEQDFTFLKAVTTIGYIKRQDGTYSTKQLPPMEFDYQQHEWNSTIKTIAAEALVHAPTGIEEAPYQFVDLFNEGLSGILTEQANGWYYNHNLGNGQFEQAKLVSPKPSFAGLGQTLQLADLDADGGKQLVNYSNDPKGYFELNDDQEWQSFQSFNTLPNIDLDDPNTRMLDLNGDGKPEIVIAEDNVFTWYAAEGRNGFSAFQKTAKPFDEETGAAILFADEKQSIYLADMSGNGMTDIVRIRNGAVCYWPNLGYGKFGAKVSLDNAPVFDHPDAFNPANLRLADIDGSGTADIIYLGAQKFTCWKNLSGNRFSTTPFEIDPFPEIHTQAKITVTDLLGNGVACIVWSSPLAKDTNAPLKYIDLMNSKKPHIMVSYKNNLGKTVSLEYTPSVKFYIEDKLAGNPWITKLHFPVHCVSKTILEDKISGYKFVSEYKYHHGYYDHEEREFRGFGRVEQIDAEHFEHWAKGNASNITEASLHQEPVVTKTWYHTGAFFQKDKILNQFAKEYWYEEMEKQGFSVLHHEVALPDARLVAAPGMDPVAIDRLSGQEWREALRACKSMVLRSETFAKDAIAFGNTEEARKKEHTPFSVATHNCIIELLQPKGRNKHAVFIVKESETITYAYERNPEDPRIAHNLNIRLDQYGNVLESATVVYPRLVADATLPAVIQQEQNKTLITYTENKFTNDVFGADTHRLRVAAEVKTVELKGVSKSGVFYTPDDFANILSSANTDEAAYHEVNKPLVAGRAQQRLIEHIRSTYYRNDLTGALPLYQLESLAIPFEQYQLAYTPTLVTDIFGTKVNADTLIEGKFTNSEGDNNWWIRSGTMQFKRTSEDETAAQNRFYSPLLYTDPYGAVTTVHYYGDYFLFIEETEDVLGNKSTVAQFNFRTLSPQKMKDSNGNVAEAISDELGMVKAIAIMGKGNEADELTGLSEITEVAESNLIQNFIDAADSDQLTILGKQLLNRATSRFIYDWEAYTLSGKPAVTATISREQHFQQLADSPIQIAFEYTNGIGEVVMKKVQAEPGSAKQVIITPDNTITINEINTGTQLRWIGNGRTIKNNKGNAVKQYEPYFAVSWQYEDHKELVETGVTPILYYDAAGRLVKTEMPDDTFSKVVFDAWTQKVYDANDTVLESDWYARRMAIGADPADNQAALKAAQHADTPNVLHVDTLGRPIVLIEHNKNILTEADEWYNTIAHRDIEGNLRAVTDARSNTVMQYKYDMLGNLVYQNSMDAGQRWLLINILSNPLRTWDERNHEFQYYYDIAQRPTHSKVTGGDGAAPLDHIFDRVIYGESLLSADRSNEAAIQALNVLGKPIQHFDTGGLIATPEYDYKGQPRLTTRRLFSRYKEVANWTDANLTGDLEDETFTFINETDALGRITRQTCPDGSSIIPAYNEAGLLSGETVIHAGTDTTSVYIKDIDYNEKGQREKIVYGNEVNTRLYYDKATFRLSRLESKRQNNDPLQDWYYTYDPVGNITQIEDKNIPLTFFNNQKVTGIATYTYDALYRLITATGRENNVALSFSTQDNWNDAPFMQQLNPGDPVAMRSYTQHFQYDSVGNMLQMRHLSAGNNWTRNYVYEINNNRLISTQVGDQLYQYPHHAQHGFITAMPHLEAIHWNFKEELIRSIRQRRNDGGTPESTYYQYDGNGQRIRKITENQSAPGATPVKKEERMYIAGYERYTRYSGADAGLERVSLSLMDEGHRYVMIETRNDIDDGTEKQLVRYQLHNHLGSAALELDETAQVISYEEYHPYGTTAYQAISATIRAAAKRYRYTGMERDEETGLEYHSARYYLPWLGRWLSADPIGMGDGVNLYRYCQGRPINHIDHNGKQSYQAHFNEKMIELILKSGNQVVINRLLVRNSSGEYRLNTSYHDGGVNAGHAEMGDRSSDAQELAIENAKQNQNDGSTYEKRNPGMSKTAVEVDIGNGVTIPVERHTARKLEQEGVFPSGTADKGALNPRNGWTRAELDNHLAAARARHVPDIPHTPAAVPHTPHAPHVHPGTPHTPHAPKSKKGGGIGGIIIGGLVFLLVYSETGDALAAGIEASPAPNTLGTLYTGEGYVGDSVFRDLYEVTPMATAEMIIDGAQRKNYGNGSEAGESGNNPGTELSDEPDEDQHIGDPWGYCDPEASCDDSHQQR
jgi:RHS repeat-associated protein